MMKRTNSSTTRTLLAFSLGLLVTPALFLVTVTAPHLAAQTAVPKQRTIDGTVVNKAAATLPGSVVYLKDTRTSTVKTFICDDAGHFHFGQLSQNTDYELWANSNGVKSNTKSISSFDDKNSFVFTLTVSGK
jgi:alpha/beta superfamily hydrolase